MKDNKLSIQHTSNYLNTNPLVIVPSSYSSVHWMSCLLKHSSPCSLLWLINWCQNHFRGTCFWRRSVWVLTKRWHEEIHYLNKLLMWLNWILLAWELFVSIVIEENVLVWSLYSLLVEWQRNRTTRTRGQ